MTDNAIPGDEAGRQLGTDTEGLVYYPLLPPEI